MVACSMVRRQTSIGSTLKRLPHPLRPALLWHCLLRRTYATRARQRRHLRTRLRWRYSSPRKPALPHITGKTIGSCSCCHVRAARLAFLDTDAVRRRAHAELLRHVQLKCITIVPFAEIAAIKTANENAELVSKSGAVGITINWARSVLETRDLETPLTHLKAAGAAGCLAGVMFSGCTSEEAPANPYGTWRDCHMYGTAYFY